MMRKRRLPLDDEVKGEMDMIRKEAMAIVDKTLELGDGDVAVGVVRGFEAGTIDIPGPPMSTRRERSFRSVMAKGAIRYLRTGNLPFNKEILDTTRRRSGSGKRRSPPKWITNWHVSIFRKSVEIYLRLTDQGTAATYGALTLPGINQFQEYLQISDNR